MSFISCLGSTSHVQTTMGAGKNSVEIAGKLHNGNSKPTSSWVPSSVARNLLIALNSGTANSHGGTFKGTAGSSTKVRGAYSC